MRFARARAAALTVVAATALSAIPAPRAHAAAASTTPDRGPKHYPTVRAANEHRAHLTKTPRRTNARAALSTAASSDALQYHGGVDGIGVTTGAPKVYLVFWGTQWGTATPAGSTNFANDLRGVAPRLQQLFAGFGTNGETWSGVMTQYCEGVATGATACSAQAPHVGYPAGGALAGIWYDNSALSPSTATGHQLAVEAVNAAAHFGNTTPSANRNAQYFIVSPPGTHPDGFNNANTNWCAWHDYSGDSSLPAATSSYGDIAFTNMPYLPDAGSACGDHFVNSGPIGVVDGVSIVAGHEYAETLTDQNPAGGWLDTSGNENADKCAWLSPGSQGGAQNVDFANGSFAMQSTWSNDTDACLISHDVFGSPAQDNFSIALSSNEATVTIGASTDATLSATTLAGNPQALTLTANGVPSGVTVSFDPPAITSGDTTTVTFATTGAVAPGAYDISVVATGSLTHTAIFTMLVIGPPGTLTNGVPVANISGPRDLQQFWVLDVAPGQESLTFAITGGLGDADLYVRNGQAPTLDTYDCRPYVSGNEESCSFDTPAAGTWYVMLNAYSDFSGVTLTGTYATAGTVALQPDVAVPGIAGATGSRQYWQLDVPPGQESLTFLSSGGTGDADMYVRFGDRPSLALYDCVSRAVGNRESCTITNPTPGSWFVLLNGYGGYSGVTLRGVYNPPTTALRNGARVRNVGGADGTDLFWKITVPPNARSLIVTLGGGGNGDLYVRFATRPTTSVFDCASVRTRGIEKCSLANPSAGDYYVMVEAVQGFTRGTLTAKYRTN